MRNGCFLPEVLSGTTKHESVPNPRRIRHGRPNNLSLPSISVPTFIPHLHHQISRIVYECGLSLFVSFFTVFQRSKSLSISSYSRTCREIQIYFDENSCRIFQRKSISLPLSDEAALRSFLRLRLQLLRLGAPPHPVRDDLEERAERREREDEDNRP